MRKLLFFFVLLATLCLEVHGQRIRLTDTTNTWRVYCDGGGTEYYSLVYTYRFNGDTIMYGSTYKRLTGTTQILQLIQPINGYPAAGTYYLREDNLAGKVWARRNTDTAEQLIYNAAWAVGDTIQKKITGGTTSFKFYVSSIDSTQMAGQWYKVFKVKNAGFQTPNLNYFDIVEGLGATIGPAYAFTGGSGGEYRINLQCFYNNGSKPVLTPALSSLYWNSNGSFANAGPCNLAVGDLRESGKSFLSPNPATGRSKIVLPYQMQQGSLIIYNSNGQTVSGTAISNTASVPLPAAFSTPGLYFYRITDQRDGLLFTGKFVYE